MVCCAFISFILACFFGLFRSLTGVFNPKTVKPLLWTLSPSPAAVTAQRFSLSARAKSVSYAVSGIRFVISNEHNARIHIAAAGAVMTLALLFKVSVVDWLILILAIVSVWFAETINTAFEYLCDVVSPEKNEAVKHAKDIAAGAVLITAMGAVIIGAIVLFPYVTNGIKQGQGGIDYAQLVADNLCLVR